MELERVGVLRTSNSDLIQFIIGALESDDVYLYHLENKKDSREFTISIYENKSKKIKKIIGGVNVNDPDSILGDYLERKDEEIKAVLDENSIITLKQNNSGLQVTSHEVDLTGKNNFFCMCNKCFTRFDSLEDLENRCIETVEDNKNDTSTTDATEIYLDRVFICYKCKAQIKIRKIKNPF